MLMRHTSYKIDDIDKLTIRNYVGLLEEAYETDNNQNRRMISNVAAAVRMGNASQEEYQKANAKLFPDSLSEDELQA